MYTHDAHLSEHVENKEQLELRALRDGFGDAIVALAREDDRIVTLTGDVTESVRLSAFKEQFPERHIECGVAEQNMALIASGLANSGKTPFVVAYAVFSPGRNWEQVRTSIALSQLPVKIMGMHTGVSVGADGATHQALEDITLMRVLPHMQVVVPCDALEAEKAVCAVAYNNAPSYVRFTRHKTPVFTTPETPFAIGKAEVFWEGEQPRVALLAAGPLLYDTLHAAQVLAQEGVATRVLNMHSIKPMDVEAVKQAARECGAVVTVEEHQILGGLGGTVAEVLTQNVPVPQEMVAVHDRFGQSGTPEELLEEYHLTTSHIVQAARRVYERAHGRG
jgi:transketolase